MNNSPEGYRADHESDTVGKRKLAKQRCLDMCWSDVKEITAWEIAWCINQYPDINITSKPLMENRKNSIENRINKMVQAKIKKEKKAQEKEKKKRLIEKIDDIVRSDPPNKFFCEFFNKDFDETATPTYIFEPKWFSNTNSAREAIFITSNISSSVLNDIMENGTRYKDGKFSQDFAAAKKAKENLIKAYEKIGISPLHTKNALNTILYKPPKTIKQHFMQEREYWIEYFIDLGNTKTNATLIATRITLLAEQSIPITAKHQF